MFCAAVKEEKWQEKDKLQRAEPALRIGAKLSRVDGASSAGEPRPLGGKAVWYTSCCLETPEACTKRGR